MKTKLIIVCACLASILAGCAKEAVIASDNEQMCELVLDVHVPDVRMTKASAYTTAQDYETSVNSVQVLVFNKVSGLLEKYYDAGTSLSGINLTSTIGEKTVWAVVNGPDLKDIQTLVNLRNTAISLGVHNSLTKTVGMVMTGSKDVTLSSTSTTCTVDVSRLVSRVVLGSVKNSLPKAYGDITLVSAMLTNVVGNQNIEGSADALEWYNRYGRADENPQVQSHMIDGSKYKATCPDLTYKAINATVTSATPHAPDTPYFFYTMPNSSANAPSAFSTTFTAQRTVLVVKAQFSAQMYYYPVVLDSAALERNKTYYVKMDITGPGSYDPNTPVKKGDCTTSVVVADWLSGTDYNVTI